MSVVFAHFESPIGLMEIACSKTALIALRFIEKQKEESSQNEISKLVFDCLTKYFSGEKFGIEVKLAPIGTAFQNEVWQALMHVEPGQTRTYEEIAHAIKSPKSARAVGAANAANKIAILTPCHRIIGKNRGLTGYAFGIDRKKWLLLHELKYYGIPKIDLFSSQSEK